MPQVRVLDDLPGPFLGEIIRFFKVFPSLWQHDNNLSVIWFPFLLVEDIPVKPALATSRETSSHLQCWCIPRTCGWHKLLQNVAKRVAKMFHSKPHQNTVTVAAKVATVAISHWHANHTAGADSAEGEFRGPLLFAPHVACSLPGPGKKLWEANVEGFRVLRTHQKPNLLKGYSNGDLEYLQSTIESLRGSVEHKSFKT